MSDADPGAARDRLIRSIIQRLESLRRSGLDRIPAPRPRPVAIRRAPVLAPTTPPPRSMPTTTPRPVAIPPAPAPTSRAPSLFGEPEIEAPLVAPEDRAAVLSALASEVSVCQRCPYLAATRTQTVFGVGSSNARLMFVGEAPGAEEDRTGIPFVGRAGMLLTDMITKGMGLTREDVYIANILKSRPPENRSPEAEEIANCLPYLERQIEIIRPAFLCLLGKTAAAALLATALPLGRLRGRWHRYRSIPTVVTYHPAYLLRNPASKKEAWEDLQMLMKAMGLTPPGRGRA